MDIKVKCDEVTVDYLTAGKVYEGIKLIESDPFALCSSEFALCSIESDDGVRIKIMVGSRCAHLNGGRWTVVN